MSPRVKKYLWNLVTALIVLAMCVGVYAATKKIDYTWRWERLPQYIIYEDIKEVKAPFTGTVSVQGKVVKITSSKHAEPFVYNNPSNMKHVNGDMILEGDTLDVVSNGYKMGPLLEGLIVTLEISFVSIIFAVIIGTLTGLARISRNPVLKQLSVLYIELIRGTPLLVQIFIMYFFIGTVFQLDRFAAGVIALSVFAGAYIAEIVRAGIQSVAKGQMEAARSLGMSYIQAMTHIIMPQAFKRTLPPMAGQFISLIKDSSLVSVISITDLTKAGREVSASIFAPFEVWFSVALLYLVLTSGLSFLVQRLELKMSESD